MVNDGFLEWLRKEITNWKMKGWVSRTNGLKILSYYGVNAEIAATDDNVRKLMNNPKSPYEGQGCFFVIALERIEELIGLLQQGLKTVDRDPEKTREEINKALIILQGQ